MLLERLILCDFGVFRGRHVFELVPSKKFGRTCPIVLFGGLNGAGKTTILTGVRLALYGRASLGPALSQREYSDFLSKSIHRDAESIVPGNAASITLEFEHSQLGERRHYRVERAWTESGRTCVETLRVLQDSAEISGLSQLQAQGFLNQLVPPGVSQFFFFDGEKIADLATEGGDQALRESIRRLLGLDLVDRLRADLTHYLRQSRQKLSAETGAQIEALNAQLEATKVAISIGEMRLREEIVPAVDKAKEVVERINIELSARGGAWAKERAPVAERIESLLEERGAVEAGILDCLGGEYPLSLAPKLVSAIEKQLRDESAVIQSEAVRSMLNERFGAFRRHLLSALPKPYEAEIERAAAKVLAEFEERQPMTPSECIHCLGEADSQRLATLFASGLPVARTECLRLVRRLEVIEDQIADLNLQLVRAPAESALHAEFDALTHAGIELGRLQQEKASLVESLRRQTWNCVDLTRKLRTLEEQASSAWSSEQAEMKASAIRELMFEFSTELTRLKLTELRSHFVETFGRLSRKEDLISDAEIDEDDFSVTLIDHKGKRIPKESLSAGERQIYAIAMLEALSRTSGRSLPVIIDTPLGRLDSKHRQKLVEKYFPLASHQVILLSTDTEVDQPFYFGLAKHVSHAYHLVFDDATGSTTAEKGYFWKQLHDEVRDVA